LNALFDPVGFWSQSSSRSYILAGSFVRWLIDKHGPDLFRKAYREGGLEGIYPVGPSELVREYEAFLDAIPLEESVVEAARLRFARKSIFKRVCAHEMAALRAEVHRHLSRKEFAQAASLTEEMLTHLPEDPSALELLATIRNRQKKTDEAIEILGQLMGRDDLGRARKARIGGRLGNLFAVRGRTSEASEQYQRLLDAHLDDGTDRLALVKLESLKRDEHGKRIIDFLERGSADGPALLQLRDITIDLPGWSTAWYLLGRQLYNQRRYEQALPYLERAGDTGLAHPALAMENLKLLAVCSYELGQASRSAAYLSVMAQFPRHQGDLSWSGDWLERIRFESSARSLAPELPSGGE
jgi:tetratricopeptide (TPR) repeat protein